VAVESDAGPDRCFFVKGFGCRPLAWGKLVSIDLERLRSYWAETVL